MKNPKYFEDLPDVERAEVQRLDKEAHEEFWEREFPFEATFMGTPVTCLRWYAPDVKNAPIRPTYTEDANLVLVRWEGGKDKGDQAAMLPSDLRVDGVRCIPKHLPLKPWNPFAALGV